MSPEFALAGPEQIVWTVSQLTASIKEALESAFPDVWVQGEVSKVTRSAAGHIYLRLKDENAVIDAVIWRGTASRVKFNLDEGLAVVARGGVEVYAPRGSYQLIVREIQPVGVGALQLAFRQLVEKLEKEGLFRPEHKVPIPLFPRRIGIVTSPTGAAIRDMIRVIQRRWPPAEIYLLPRRVQGEGAAEEIAAGIRLLNRERRDLDVIIVGRGGGSLEDLWPFNEETVARAIFVSTVPVISAVGHETDFSISDFVADVRAPTPSAAAEMVVPDRQAVAQSLAATLSRITRGLRHQLERLRDDLALFESNRHFRFPQEMVLSRVQTIDDLLTRLAAVMRDQWTRLRFRLERATAGLAQHAPRAAHERAVGRVKMAAHRLATAERTLLAHRWLATVDRLSGRLGDLNPNRILARGYSRTVLERTGRTLTRAADARPGDVLQTHLAEGELKSRVTERSPRRPEDQSSLPRPDKTGRDTPKTLFDEEP